MAMTLGACPVCGTLPDPRAILCPNDGTELISPSFDPLVNTVIGSYRIIRRLGVGGMGAVYEAVEVSSDQRVAFKIVHPAATDRGGAIALREAQAVNAVGERGIVQISGVGSLADGREYLVMELLVGESLDVRIKRKGVLSLAEAVEISASLLTTLEAAHRAGFVHRDLKASNVFVVQPTQGAEFPKLLDFGIATKETADLWLAQGTADYVAPEQAAGLGAGPEADLYAFGCLLFEMLTGHVPFALDSSTRVPKENRFSERPNLRFERPEIPEAVSALVVELMQAAPKDRPGSALLVNETLQRAAGSVKPEARPAQSPPRRRRPWLLGVPVVLGVGLAVVLLSQGAAQPAEAPSGAATDAQTLKVHALVAGIEAQLDAGLVSQADEGAIDRLLSAERAFPGRGEWPVLRATVVASLISEGRRAISVEEPERALECAAALERLDPGSTEAAAWVTDAHRIRFAHGHGMVRVGTVFIDAYEFPNRAKALPMSRVDWAQANKLCSDQRKHLCTDEEWGAACQGVSHRTYAYGADLKPQRCNSKELRPRKPVRLASGSLLNCVTEEGVFDLAGNLAEWTSTPLSDKAAQRIIRGGSFKQPAKQSSCEAREALVPGRGGADHVGFRCCF